MTDRGRGDAGATSSPERPELRPVQYELASVEGEDRHVLTDASGYVEDPVALTTGAAVLAQLFDGSRTVAEVGEAAKELGVEAPVDLIVELAEELDRRGFLRSPAFDARRRGANEAYRAQGVRPPRFAGESYPEDPEGVRTSLADRFAAVDRAATRSRWEGRGPIGIIAPHIDLRVAGSTYAEAYAAFDAGTPPPDLFVVVGTCHGAVDEPFVVSSIGFDTPLGPVPTDPTLVDRLAARLPWDVFASEAVHGGEHSLEFQALHLRYLFGERTPPMLGILTGRIEPGRRDVETLVEAIGEVLAPGDRRVCYVAGADLSHVGPRFDDPEPVDEVAAGALAGRDRRTLAAIEAGDAAAFREDLLCDDNARRVCGLWPIETVMRCCGDRPAALESYLQWAEDGSVVSFAALTLADD